jgi:fructose-1,6-bisphosphatase II
MPAKERPDRNLAMELVRVTESAALAAAGWVGRGDKKAADGAAVDAMRNVLDTVSMDGIVVIGEGEKDEAPMLYNGERNGSTPHADVAVDPIDGTTLTAMGRGNALSVIAVAERGSMFNPGPCFYMEKIAVGPEAASAVDLDFSPTKNIKEVARAMRKLVSEVTVMILERDRHNDLIAEVRKTGVGGTPEGVVAAAALKAMGGEILGRLSPRNDAERDEAIKAGYDLSKVLTTNDLVRGNDVFFAATGVTDGELLRGVRYDSYGARSHSLVMRSRSGTIRYIDTHHRHDRLTAYFSTSDS